MANFIALVYATLKEKGIDTSKMSTDEAVSKFKELQGEIKEKETPEKIKEKLGGEKQYTQKEKEQTQKENAYKKDTSFENNQEIDWDLVEKNEKINGKNAKNPKRTDKYGNELLSDDAFNIGVDAGKTYLDYMTKYNNYSSLKKSNRFLGDLSNVVGNAITNNGFNPNLDITYQDYNEIIGNILGEEINFEKYESMEGTGFTNREYIGYKPNK